jgi:hypothetical protein
MFSNLPDLRLFLLKSAFEGLADFFLKRFALRPRPGTEKKSEVIIIVSSQLK